VVDIYRLKKAVPDEVNMPDIIFELSRIAAQSRLSFQSIQPGLPTLQSNYEVLPVVVTFQGTFRQLSGFLGRIRHLVEVRHGNLGATGRLYTIDSIGLAEGQPAFPQLLATITLDAYVYGSSIPVIPGVVPSTAQTAASSTTTPTETTQTTTTSSSSADATPPPTTPPAPSTSAPTSAAALGAQP
jgi:hypothetical protein